MEEDSAEMIDLTGINDSVTMTDAEFAERLQMEELETLNQSDFEVARHLQEMERQHASSHMIPELFMFGESMRRSNSGYRAEARRLRPPRPPPPRPTRFSRTSNNDELNADSGELSTDNPSDDTTYHNGIGHQDAAASAASATASRHSLARRAHHAMNRNRGRPAVTSDGASNEPEHLQDAVNHRDPVAGAADQDISATNVERLQEAMNRNRRGHLSFFMPQNFPVTDGQQSRVYQTRNRNRWAPPVPTMPQNDAAADVEETRDALNHNHLNPTALTAQPTDAVDGDAEQQGRVGPPPPLPPRRQRRPPRNRRMLGGSLGTLGLLQFSMHPTADYHDHLEMPGWAPVRRHYEYSRLLDDDDGSGNNYEALWALSEQIGEAGNKGLNLIQITRLPTMKYRAPSSTVTSDDMVTSDDAVSSSSESMSDAALAGMETVCRVCLCGFENGEDLRALPCCHRFHVDCIDQWIKQNAICPVCRDNIKDHFRDGGGDQWNQ